MTYALAKADIDRFTGTILGAALGDVLGWPHEQRASRVGGRAAVNLEMHEWVKRSGGGYQPHEELIEAGAYSDDTQLLLAVARSRLAGGDWWRRLATIELPFWTVYQRGGGGASLRAARLLLKGVLPWESPLPDRAKYFEAGGNGVAMRIAPHVLVHAHDADFRTTASDILADGVLTHGHPRALVGALAYGFALWVAIQNRHTLSFGEIVERVAVHVQQWAFIPPIDRYWPGWLRAADASPQFHRTWDQAVREVIDGLIVVRAGLSTGALAFDEETLRELRCFDPKVNGAGTVAALAAIFLGSKHAASPFEGVARAALAHGADTDTIASMTGALAGAIAGTDWLGHLGGRIQDNRYLADVARHLMGPRATHVSDPKRLKQTDLSRFIADLKKGVSNVDLPVGGRAIVTPHYGIRSKSDRLEINAWHLQSEMGQTFVVKSLSVLKAPAKRQTQLPSPKQPGRALPLPVGRGPSERSPRKALGPAGVNLGFVGIALHVHDLELSKEFYSVLLGLKVTRESPGRVQLGTDLVLQLDSDVPAQAKAGVIYISVADAESCREEIADRLGLAVSPIARKSGQIAFMCRDPDGYALEVFQR